jgi:hypothetical protein
VNETSYQKSAPQPEPKRVRPPAEFSTEELGRIFNTVMVSTVSQENADFPEEFKRIMDSPAFKCILGAIHAHSEAQKLPIRQATEQVIQTFRKLDDMWRSYIYREGVDRLGGGR